MDSQSQDPNATVYRYENTLFMISLQLFLIKFQDSIFEVNFKLKNSYIDYIGVN